MAIKNRIRFMRRAHELSAKAQAVFRLAFIPQQAVPRDRFLILASRALHPTAQEPQPPVNRGPGEFPQKVTRLQRGAARPEDPVPSIGLSPQLRKSVDAWASVIASSNRVGMKTTH
jgi:hypothetical protein